MKSQIVTKYNSNCDITQKNLIVTKHKNHIVTKHRTQIVTTPVASNLNTQVETKLKNFNWVKTKKNLICKKKN